MRAFCIFIPLLLITLNYASAQNEANNWYFGNHSGLTFTNGTGTAITNSSINIYEGSGSISDKNGNLLFYTDGMTVWNKNHMQMPNGFGLAGAPSSGQSGMVIPKPGSDHLYYVFTVDENAGNSGLRFSIVDMDLDNGLGDVSVKNSLLFAPATEKMAAVQHANGIDVWFICHKWESNEFVAYLLTETGLLTTSPIISKVGTVHEGHVSRSRGYMKLSPQGDKLALAIESMNSFELYDFNNLTGKISNPIIFPDDYTTAYGVEFSPDGNFLYGSERWGHRLYQFDISSKDLPTILASKTTLSTYNAEGIQLAPDGKLYVARGYNTLGIVNNPTESGISCNYDYSGVSLAGSSEEGLPGFNASYFDRVNFTWDDHCPETETEFKLINPWGIISVTWYFEYPSNAPENMSNNFNPTHVYSIGTYEVKLIAQYADKTDTIIKSIEIGAPSEMNLGEDREICIGEKLCASSGFTNLLWSDGTLFCNCIIPSVSGEYWVKGTDEQGCSEISDTVFITVNPNPEISYEVTDETTPNAFNGAIDISITNGTAPYSFAWSIGANTEDIDNLDNGWYTLTVTDDNACRATAGINVGGPYDCDTRCFQLTYTSDAQHGIICRDMAIDNSGNIYITGDFLGTLNFMGQTITSHGIYHDIFIAKFSSSGQFNWVKTAGGELIDGPTGIAVDHNGNVFITGHYKGTAYFGNVEITALENYDLFVAKYNTNGAFKWVRTAGGIDSDTDSKITVDLSGNCIITGFFKGKMYFENDSVVDIGTGYNSYVAKYDAVGNLDWLRTISCSSNNMTSDIKAYNNDEIFITGYSNGNTYFNELTVYINNGFVATYNSEGEIDHVVQLDEPPLRIALKNNDIFLGGWFSNVISFEDTTLYPIGGYDAWIAKYTDNDFKWIKQIGSIGHESLDDLEPDNQGNVYVLGSYKDNLNIDGHILSYESFPGNNNTNSFITKYDTLGNFVWFDKITTKKHIYSSVYTPSIDIDLNGNPIIAGAYIDQPEIGNFNLPEDHGGVFIAKYSNTNSSLQINHEISYPECGVNGAIVDLTVTGGGIPYTYLWSNGETTEDLINVEENEYSVIVKDIHECIITDTAQVGTYIPISVSADITNVSIAGANDGIIDITVTGGTAPYTYMWSNGKSTEDLSNLSPGTYTVVITDNEGTCSITASFKVSEPDTPIQAVFNVSFDCNTGQGCIDLTISGGTFPYTILWSNGEITEDICGLSEGWYSVTVSDAEFIMIDSVFLSQGSVMSTQINSTNTCSGIDSGSAILEITGGAEPYYILWSNNETNDTIQNLSPGEYIVTITDAENCSVNDTIEIFEDQAPDITEAPIGINQFCNFELYQNTYSTPAIGADYYMWSLEPAESGEINGNDVIAYVDWNYDFVGSVEVKVKAVNHCGEGSYSPLLYVSINELPYKPDMPTGENTVCTGEISEYSTSIIPNATSYSWNLTPSEAGTITENSNSAAINWNEAYSGLAALSVKTLNICGTSNWSDTLDININELPTSFISGDTVICAGGTAVIPIEFTGEAPWDFSYSNGFNTGSIHTSNNPYFLYVSDEGSYEVTEVYDNNCTGVEMNGQAIIIVEELPNAQFSYLLDHLQARFTNNSEFANTYLWNFGDGQTSNEINPIHNYSEEGIYDVSLSAYNNYCSASTITQSIVISDSKISESNLYDNVHVYPNPASDFIILEINNPKNELITIDLFDLNGNKVIYKVYKPGESKMIMEMNQLPAGLYTMKIVQDTETAFIKIAVIHR